MRPKAAIIGGNALAHAGALRSGVLKALLSLGVDHALYIDGSEEVELVKVLITALETEPSLSVFTFTSVADLMPRLLEDDIELGHSLAIAMPPKSLGCTHHAWTDWRTLVADLRSDQRRATVHRRTKETAIECRLNLDHSGVVRVQSGLAFFDHMLEQIAKHAGVSMHLEANGDLEVDAHHTVEDVGLVLGEAFKEALGTKRGIARFGAHIPMDEARAEVLIDLSGRAFAKFEGDLPSPQVGDLPCEMVPHFFRSFSDALGCNLHVRIEGENTHHMVEIAFKGLGRALRQAIAREGDAIPSTKGSL